MTLAQPLSLRRRRNRIVRFFARVILSAIFWDVIVRNLGGRAIARRSALQRYTALARRFHNLAVDLGGVMIKLGQFISSRVDILPPEITRELSGLQDEVPPEPFQAIRAAIESELGRPLEAAFAAFDERPIAAASLGQAYRATLSEDERVVVKVQRPGIEAIIAVDLDAIAWAVGWLKRYRPIARRANLDALFEEFRVTLYEEIDYLAEGRNAEHFAADFASWGNICIPAIHWTHSTRRVLTMEDVGAIKITDVGAFEAEGVKRHEVAKTLFAFYLQQVFGYGFFHADPHPGNLFVEPRGGEHFTLNVVDFGMVGRLTPEVKAHLRDGFIGVALRDPSRLVRAMNGAGWLLPSADLSEIERAAEKAFSHYWGISMGEIRNLDLNVVRGLLSEFRQLLIQMPFQIPSNVLFLGRALGILSGLATSIDPQFNVFAAAEPFAKQMIAIDQSKTIEEAIVSQVVEIGGAMVRFPLQADRLTSLLLRGDAHVHVNDTDKLIREMHRLNRTMNRLVWVLMFAATLLAAIMLDAGGHTDVSPWALAAAVIALVLAFWGR